MARWFLKERRKNHEKNRKIYRYQKYRNREFLVDYKSNKGAFAYSSTWTNDIQDASTGTLEAIEKQGDRMYKVAEALGGELLLVNATYELETLDGNEPKDLTEEIKEAKRKHFENFLRGLLAENDDEED